MPAFLRNFNECFQVLRRTGNRKVVVVNRRPRRDSHHRIPYQGLNLTSHTRVGKVLHRTPNSARGIPHTELTAQVGCDYAGHLHQPNQCRRDVKPERPSVGDGPRYFRPLWYLGANSEVNARVQFFIHTLCFRTVRYGFHVGFHLPTQLLELSTELHAGHLMRQAIGLGTKRPKSISLEPRCSFT